MGLSRTPKTRVFHRIGDRYATLFDADHFLGRNAFEENWMTEDLQQPPINIKKKEGLISLEIALPGFKKEEVCVAIKNDVLEISAERKVQAGEKEYVEKEVPNKLALQAIQLTPDVDQDKITAHLENGMLYIEIPHSKTPSHKTKTIDVT